MSIATNIDYLLSYQRKSTYDYSDVVSDTSNSSNFATYYLSVYFVISYYLFEDQK